MEVHTLVFSVEGRKIASNTNWQFLLARISANVREIRNLECDLHFEKRQIEFILRPEHMKKFTEALWREPHAKPNKETIISLNNMFRVSSYQQIIKTIVRS